MYRDRPLDEMWPLPENDEDRGHNRSDLNPLIDAAGSFDYQMVAVNRDYDAVLLVDLARLECKRAVSPEKERVNRGFQKLLVAFVDRGAVEKFPLDQLIDHLLVGFAGTALTEGLNLMSGQPTGAHQEIELAGEPGTRGHIADSALLE